MHARTRWKQLALPGLLAAFLLPIYFEPAAAQDDAGFEEVDQAPRRARWPRARRRERDDSAEGVPPLKQRSWPAAPWGGPPPDLLLPPRIGRSIEELRARARSIEERIKGFSSLAQRLSELEREYGRPEQLEAFEEERRGLRTDLSGRILEFDKEAAAFTEARDALQEKLARHLLALGLNPEDSPTFQNFKRADKFAADLRAARERGDALLREDETRYRQAQEQKKRDKRGGTVFLLMLLALGVTTALALRYRREKNRLINEQARALGSSTPLTVQAEPAGEPPQKLLPAPGTPPAAPSAAARPAADDWPPGTVIGGIYRVERELGRGGMGVVYEAFDTALERKVAIKKVRDEIREVARDYELFLKEARLVASLRHPNVVEIYSILQEDGQILLVFEHVGGYTLREVLNKSPGYRLAIPSVKRTVAQVGSALAYAHGKKVIHRDLKPSNIMVTREGETRVMDFGIAHRAKMTVAKQTHTQAWGTPPYMAPEQELGMVSKESDLFALGVCLYEMLTGRMPYEGPNFLAQKSQMLFPLATRVLPSLPESVDSLFEKALAAKPERRFHSAEEFVAALSALPG